MLLLVSVRLVSLATQHFLYDVMTDARQFQRLRSHEKKDTNVRHTTIRQRGVHGQPLLPLSAPHLCNDDAHVASYDLCRR